jgi:hypothetical protein
MNHMTPETVKAISEALKPLADKLNQSAEFVFQAYALHAYATGVAMVITAVAVLAVSAGLLILVLRKWSQLDEGQFFAPVGIMLTLGLALPLLAIGIMHLIAPQYYAIHDILCTVKDCTR